jgi:hypothetical protein
MSSRRGRGHRCIFSEQRIQLAPDSVSAILRVLRSTTRGEHLLQLLDQAAQRRLGHVQMVGGQRKTAGRASATRARICRKLGFMGKSDKSLEKYCLYDSSFVTLMLESRMETA